MYVNFSPIDAALAHPLLKKKRAMTFLENCWYAAAFSDEITRTPISRVILGEPMALYRKESGEPVALHDRCPHRFAPLHAGKVFGDAIRCPYHGLRFGPDGRCVENPVGNGHIPRAAAVPSFVLREIDGIIWLWHGTLEPDDSKLIRFKEFEQTDRWTSIEALIPIAAAYTLVSDNLLDLSHAEFLHPDLAAEGFAKRAQLTVTQEGETVVANNWRPAEPISNASRLSMGGAEAPDHIDRKVEVRWDAPANMRFHMSDRPVGQHEGGTVMVAAHLITPETETTSHYFFKMARDFLVDSEETSSKLRSIAIKAFNTEDKPMIEAQQRNIGKHSFDDLNPVLLSSDVASALSRRLLRAKLEAQVTASALR
ncbi:MAG TPA: aromatic ring-hydroxylating dioxygenase subunit alpha [Paraburkholderia sp.]|uniref:aromatic ring-hydroxylating dioxygenase subunit alpha n=1 Tax=Paraburkholderia sp. TaxID=1926495 RepID=UPI002B46DCAB|nr:aromatic ring-hydroxylating dioxygenase subunit alpha [Paraburkholderia sp.]HKR46926.1 aromatic ring-hydroxylating dioxygenase subunit alpha [Paraburkholderia sp.]